ncbi:MAG TPA: MATE family efflux transporter [Clostridiaceae bacterium]|nr:MATE family efflux transporter [Clostridiaceae bacterium]
MVKTGTGVGNGARIKAAARKYVFSDKKFYTSMLTIAMPIVLQNFIGSSLNMVDTVMIGQVGEDQIAAVGIANQYFLLFVLFILGIHSGCGVFISQFWGKGDRHNIRKVLLTGLITSVALSVLFMIPALFYSKGVITIFNNEPSVVSEGSAYLKIVCASYIFTALSFGYGFASRSIGNALMPMAASIAGLVSNAVLNYILIFGKLGAPAMGVRGAAIATVIARAVETLIMMAYIYASGKNVLAVRLSESKGINRDFVIKVFKTVIPVVLNESSWALGFVAYSVAYGRIGANAITAVQICNTVQNMFTVALFGLAGAAAVMVGHKIGEGNEEEGKIYAWRFIILSLVGGLAAGGLLAASSPLILSFFKVSAGVYESALWILYMTSVIMVARCFNIITIVGILRGAGDARFAFIAEGITMWFVGVPLSFIGACVLKLPVHYVVALVTVEEVVKSIIVLIRLFSNKWVKNVVNEFAGIM